MLRHRPALNDKLDCPHALGTNAFSPQRADSFRHIVLLPPAPLVHYWGKLSNLRVSHRARAAPLPTPRLWLCSHARARSPAVERTATGHAGRWAEVAEARSIAAFDRESPTQAK